MPAISTSCPPGDGWAGDPFEARIADGVLTGRGANDMKSAIAAFVAAVSRVDQARGTCSLLITGDEEGPSTHGTPAIIRWLNERAHQARHDPDRRADLRTTRLGDTVKIGRRGSVNMWIDVPGTQGHVAYPHRADNPIAPVGADRRGTGRAASRRRHRRLPAVEPRVHRNRLRAERDAT